MNRLRQSVSPLNHETNGNEADEEKREEAQEPGRVQARGRADPGQPTAEERRKHNITHLPYRSWCADCVAGRGRGFAHTSHQVLGEDALPTVGMDYHYMGIEGEEGTVPMLCVKCVHTKMVFDHVVTKKGVDKYMVSRVLGGSKTIGVQAGDHQVGPGA